MFVSVEQGVTEDGGVRCVQTILLGSCLLTLTMCSGGGDSTTGQIETTATNPTTQSTAAVSATGQALQAQIEEATPFVKTDGGGRQQFSTEGAIRAGVSTEAIVLAEKLVSVHNRLIDAAGDDMNPGVMEEDFSFIEPFFQRVVEGDVEIGDDQEMESVPDSAVTRNHCSSRAAPARCPDRVTSSRRYATRGEAVSALLRLGYHKTPNYACLSNKNDYSVGTYAAGCSNQGAFRTQALILEPNQDRNYWTWQTQTPEPNPEVLSYIWPHLATWWVSYVRWWHYDYCN